MVSVREGRMPFRGFETYYRIANPAGKKAPLVLLHGGPGSTHNYFEGFDKIAETLDRPIVMYDQIGCGESATPGHTELYTAEVWMDELDALREHLSLDKVHLLGQSWGGMLAISYMIERKPAGVLSVALASTLHAAEVWKQEQYRRIEHYMAPEDLSVFHTAEKTGNYDDPAYLDALDRFMDLFCGPTVTDNAPNTSNAKRKTAARCISPAGAPMSSAPPARSRATITGDGSTRSTPRCSSPAGRWTSPVPISPRVCTTRSKAPVGNCSPTPAIWHLWRKRRAISKCSPTG